MPETLTSRAGPGRSGRRCLLLGHVWALRLGLVLFAPVVALGLVELLLRGLKAGEDTAFFVPDAEPGYFRTNPAFTNLFFPEQFGLKPLDFRLRQQKGANAIRVFVLGESAVFGTPEPAFSMVEQLRAQLRGRYPEKQIEVFNLGITAINSHVILRVVRDVLSFEPDVLVIYAGNNEVIGPYGPGSVSRHKIPSLRLIRTSLWLRELRIGQMLLRVVGGLGGSGGASEWHGMRTFSENAVRTGDERLSRVYEHFERNLHDAVKAAEKAKVPVVLSTVVANLRDTAPFLSLHREDISAADLQSWKTSFDAGLLAWKLGDHRLAADQLGRARELDPEYADTHFVLGKIAAASGRLAAARRYFADALHFDALRFRPDAQINTVIRRVAREHSNRVTLLDAARELGADAESEAAPSGHELLFEHVHFNFAGNQRIGRLLAENCARVLPRPGGSGTWLGEDECAAALGYTDYGQLETLFGIRALTQTSPFTNQITFGEDQTRLGHAIDTVSTRLLSPDALRSAAEKVEEALRRDEENPFLLICLEAIEFQRGNHARALALIEAVAALRPKSAEMVVKRATILRLLKRYNEAEEILRESLVSEPNFMPTFGALAEIWAETAQLAKGRAFFDRALDRTGSRYVRRSYADLLLRCGERLAAERLYQQLLREDPSDEGTLARLGQLLSQSGRPGEALELMLAGYRFQPKNYANNARLAQLFETRDEAERAAEFMQAMTESGPANSALCLRLAQRLAQLGRREEMLVALRQAKAAAEREGNVEAAAAAEEMYRRAGARRVSGLAD